MSCTLHWRKVYEESKTLHDELKRKITDKYSLPRTFTASDIPYLEGLEQCNVKGATELLAIIREHYEVELMESY